MQEPAEPVTYHVVVNHEDRRSIWPATLVPPPGWRRTGPAATRETCLERIAEEWTDIRPRPAAR